MAAWEYAIPGYNTYKILSNLGGVKNALEGDPNSLVSALNGLMQTAYQRGDQTKNFLMGREANAEQYYRPMQQMFGNMYGSGGMMPAKAPGVPGSTPTGRGY